jgi:hypothetical protein
VKDNTIDNISVAVELARELSPAVVARLMLLVETGSPDAVIKASRALISIMSLDRTKIW